MLAHPHADIRSALIVHAHPEPKSFSTSQARVAQEELRACGVSVKLLDLYAMEWSPVLAAEQFGEQMDYFKPQAAQLAAVADDSLREPVRSQLADLHEADFLILSFPLWWFSLPAILKGWMDRVLVMGSAFGGDHGIFDRGGMRGKRAMLVVTTGGAEQAFRPGVPDGFGGIDEFLFHIHRGMLEFCGFEVLPPLVTFAAARLDEHERAGALQRVREAMRTVVLG